MSEIWKQIPFAHLYEASTLGNVRNSKTNKLLKIPNIENLKKKQTRVRIGVKNNDNKHKGYYLHRLICETFIPNPNNYKEVNHIDCNPYNNNIVNLEWCSHKQNMEHFYKSDKSRITSSSRSIIVIDKTTGKIISEYDSVTLCLKKEKININFHTFYNMLTNYKYKNRYSIKEKSKDINNFSSKYKGVIYDKKKEMYKAFYMLKKKGLLQKFFSTEKEAAECYDDFQRKMYGIDAVVNFPKLNEKKAIKRGPGCYKSNANQSQVNLGKTTDVIINNKIYKFKIDDDKPEDDKTEDDKNIIWKDLVESDKYEVSNTGLVRQKRLRRILKGYNRNGYRQVNIRSDNTNNKNGNLARLIHRLVAQTFIPNPNNKLFVDHIDTNILNNDLTNLRWVTPKENMNNERTLENLRKGKINVEGNKTVQIDIDTGKIIKEFISASKVERELNIPQVTVCAIRNYYKKYSKNKKGQGQKTYKKKYIFIDPDDIDNLDKYLCIAKKRGIKEKKAIIQYHKTTNKEICKYESIYEAAKKLNLNCGGISQVCNYYKYTDDTRPVCYKLKSTGGYIFRFCSILPN
jgi:hypothetical protein